MKINKKSDDTSKKYPSWIIIAIIIILFVLMSYIIYTFNKKQIKSSSFGYNFY